jgi:hypothetical protein
MTLREQARTRVEQLVHEFRTFLASKDEADINEERVKIGFIAPMLEALGWNMRTDEVLPEQRTLVGEADFGLRAYGATPQVYVECKPFRESLDGHRIERGRQVTYPEKAIQYAWSMKADWAILTNFKKLRLYYSRVRKPSEGLVFEVSFEEYAGRFEELWLISKESVTSGAIETYRKRATRNYVDEEFLRDLVECRQLLVDNIRDKNPALSPEDLNEAAQRILDRIIFVRSCEDRSIVPAEMLWKHYVHWDEVAIDKTVRTFMMDLKNMFRDIDRVYNGKLFEPHMCEDLKIDNTVLQEILERLYGDGDRSGYRFDAIPVNVLGQAYELYIGSVIKEKAGAVRSLEIVEDYKKRQQHGIYYTPTFVTHFITKRTLGDALKRTKTGDDVLKLKLVDQAAGSGSFLIEAFDQLKGAYLTYKREHQRNSRQAPLEAHLVQPDWTDPENTILQNNIYGVDLDPQAVEITTLNLELKAVKTKGRIPYLGEHIKRGNSIIQQTADGLLDEFTEDELMHLLGEDWRTEWAHKYPFRYHEAFRQVMGNGGFDIVIGNPPYNNMRDSELKIEQAYCERFHKDVFRGNSDILFYFIESGLSVLKAGGLLGLIVARYFMKSEEGDRIRRHVLEHSKIRYVVDTRNAQVFGRVNVLTCIIVLERDDSPAVAKANHKIKVANVKNTFKGTLEQLFEHIDQHIEEEDFSDDWVDIFEREQDKLTEEPWTLEPPAVERLLEKIRQDAWQLESPETCQVGVGYDTELNEAKLDREMERKDAPKHGVFILTEREAEELGLEKRLLVRMVKGFQIQRYALLDQGYVLLNTDSETDIDRYPNAKKHLARFRKQLEERDAMPRCKWFGVGLPKNRELFEDNPTKILVPKYATENKFAYDDGEGYYCISDGYIVARNQGCKTDLRYVLAILNSRMMEFYHKKVGKLKREGYYEYFAEQLRRLPIKRIDLSNKDQKAIHDGLVDNVSNLTDAKKRLLQLQKTFAECTALYPPDEKRSQLKSYYEYNGIQATVLEDFNRKKGTIYTFRVSVRGNKIRLSIDYLPEEITEETVHTGGTPALDLSFDDERVRDFVYYSFRKFLAETNKRTLGRGNILKTLQTEILIPCYFANHQENIKVIHRIMSQFRARTKGLLEKEATLAQLEEEIQSLDETIETEVRKLYRITNDEAQIIQTELML